VADFEQLFLQLAVADITGIRIFHFSHRWCEFPEIYVITPISSSGLGGMAEELFPL
jgi:hypothetical protein